MKPALEQTSAGGGTAALAAGPAAPARPSLAVIWWLAARPKTLLAAASPVLVGSACALAVGGFQPWPALAALAGALLLQIAANFANDVFDFEKGADTQARIGPTRVVQAGWVSPTAMRRGLLVVLGLALAIGVYLVSIAGPVLIAVGLSAMLAAVAYTGGPYPLGYHGLGDVFVMLFFGFVAVTGTSLVQVGHVPALAWLASVPVGCLATGILVVNNVRDADTDAVAGKRTLAVRFGRRFAILQYRALLVSAYGVTLVMAWSGGLGLWALLPWLTLALAVGLSRSIERDSGSALNTSLAGTARLLFLFSVLLSLSILLGSMPWPTSSS
jgi:1,4-dihydroxy-2-naphthoate polyprenyltransferase